MELLLLEIPPPIFCKILNDLERIPRKLRRTSRTREEFHANLEIEEILGHMFPSIAKSRPDVLAFQYKHWFGFSYKCFTGYIIAKQFSFCKLTLRSNVYRKVFILLESIDVN